MVWNVLQGKSCTSADVVFELNQCDRRVSVFSVLYAAGGSLGCDCMYLNVSLLSAHSDIPERLW